MTFWNGLSSDVQLLLVLIAFMLPVMAMIGVFTWRDARRHEMNPMLWAIVAALTPALIGFILYLLARSNHSHLLCTGCGKFVHPGDSHCPSCGAKLRPTCPECGTTVDESWNSCPACAAPLPEAQELTPTARPRNKALWALLGVLIVVPMFYANFTGMFIMLEPDTRYFHTRYTLDAELNENLIDPEYLNPESWYKYTLTNKNGTITVAQYTNASTGGSYTITAPDGTIQHWRSGTGGGTRVWPVEENFLNFSEKEGSLGNKVFGCGRYFYNDSNQLIRLELDIGQQIDHWASKPVYQIHLTFEYDPAGNLIRQDVVRVDQHVYENHDEWIPAEETRRYVTYAYDDAGLLILAQEYDSTDTLTGYTTCTWILDGKIRLTQSHSADGKAGQRSVTELDDNGRLLRQEFYDSENYLVQSAEFSYDPVEAMMAPSTLTKLALLWIGMLFFAGGIVSSANKETY